MAPATDKVIVHAYRFSVYCWIARLTLTEKGVDHEVAEINPFELDDLNKNSNPHPFNRVPVLTHGDIRVIETSAVCRYVNDAFDGPALYPDNVSARARINQVISVTDAYGYWPLVRQVYAHAVFAPRFGEQVNEEEISVGLEAAQPLLNALEALAGGGKFLVGDDLSLADCHLAPILSYFSDANAGARLLSARPKLDTWFHDFSRRSAFLDTKPA